MSRLALVVWTIMAPTLMGIFVLIVLVVPSLAAQDMKLIAPAAGLGAVVALPFSMMVAKAMDKTIFKK